MPLRKPPPCDGAGEEGAGAGAGDTCLDGLDGELDGELGEE